MAAKVRHLLFRAGRYYARRGVPKKLRSIVGKSELLEALGAGRSEALRRLPGTVHRMQETLEAAQREAKTTQTPRLRKGRTLSAREMALGHYADQMRFDDELRNSDARYAHGFVDDDYVAQLRRAVSGAAPNDELQKTVGYILHKFQANRNTTATPGSPEWREVGRALATAELESLARTAERDDGDFTGEPSNPLLIKTADPTTATDPLSARIIGPDSTKTLTELIPTLIAERGARLSTNHEIYVTARMFEEYLEEDRPVYRITKQDMHGFKRILSETPANYVKRFSGTTLPHAVKANKARAKPYRALSTRTINNKYLSRMHSILNWCVRSEIIPDNPASGIKVDAIKSSERPRVNFSPDDLTRLFNPKHFSTSKPFNETQWAMMISLFSGMRASELAQIKLNSVRTERGVLVFAVEEETKNAGSQRLIPVHSTILVHGLEKWVAVLRNRGESHLFPEWYQQGVQSKTLAATSGKATLNLYFPRFIPKRFNVTYLPKVGIIDSRKRWHSFRHTFKTGLARAGVPRSMQDDLCGHADNSAGAGYVHGESVEAMQEAIEKLRFDGFGLKP